MTGRLIGLGGALAAGKDTFADHLVAEHGWVKVGMSDPLHKAMLTLDPIVAWPPRGAVTYSDATVARGYTQAKADYPEYRRLLQVFGTEVARELFGEDVWVGVMMDTVIGLRAEGTNVAVTGIRYPNELRVIRLLGGESVWIERPESRSAATHKSENSVHPSDFDRVIFNETLTRFLAEADTLHERTGA